MVVCSITELGIIRYHIYELYRSLLINLPWGFPHGPSEKKKKKKIEFQMRFWNHTNGIVFRWNIALVLTGDK